MFVKTKALQIEPLDLASDFSAGGQRHFCAKVQELYNAGRPVRIIVLKARQLGISTAAEALLFNWCFMHPGCNALVLSKSTADSEHLFEMAKLMWEHWPFKGLFTESHKSVRRLSWSETGSSMKIATAKGQEVGRGQTIHAVHCSEVAFYPDPERLMLSLKQAVPDTPGTIMTLESTANGAGDWFYDQWFAAKAGETEFVPMFFPWWMHDEYRIADTTLSMTQLAPDERELMKKFPEIDLPRIAWRRFCIQNKCNNDLDQFKQEYPADDHEAFLVTGRNKFPLDKLDRCYQQRNGDRGFLTPIRDPLQPQGKFHKDSSGDFVIFKEPNPSQQYVVAADPTRTTWGDPACIQVLNWRSFEQVAVFHAHIEPADLADRIAEIGFYYNTATVNCEIEGGGLATINMLTSKMFYPKVWRWRLPDRDIGRVMNSYGWSMNWQRKQMCCAFLIDKLGQGMLRIHDEVTYEQMRDYVVLPNGELGPARSSGCDDAVTSLMIAVASIELELRSYRPSEDALQSYSLDILGDGQNTFSPSLATVPATGDINGMPWWEAMEDGW